MAISETPRRAEWGRSAHRDCLTTSLRAQLPRLGEGCTWETWALPIFALKLLVICFGSPGWTDTVLCSNCLESWKVQILFWRAGWVCWPLQAFPVPASSSAAVEQCRCWGASAAIPHSACKRWAGPLGTLRTHTFSKPRIWRSHALKTVFAFFLPSWRASVKEELCFPVPKAGCLLLLAVVLKRGPWLGRFYLPECCLLTVACDDSCSIYLHISFFFFLWWEQFCSCLIIWALRACLHLHFQFQVLRGKAASSWYLLEMGSAITLIGHLSPSCSFLKYI